MRPWWLLVLAILGCERPGPRTPVAGYRTFAEAVRRSDARGAWASLSGPTRAALEARTRRVAAASGGLIKEDPASLIFPSGARPGPVGEVKLLQSDARTAVVEVAGASGPQRIAMVREGEAWLVDLEGVLEREQTP